MYHPSPMAASPDSDPAGSARAPVLPPRAEAPALVPSPGGLTWRVASDARVFNLAPYALLLQVSHPVIGAGVDQHSNFKREQWKRLFHTLDYVNATVYGGPDLAWSVGRRVREMHKAIKGELPGGGRYHALEPGPYAWVHATLIESILRAHDLFGLDLTPDEKEEMYSDWLRLGRFVGVRDGDLPADWASFGPYFDEMVEGTLMRTQAAEDVLEALDNPTAPPVRLIGDRAWKVLSPIPSRVAKLATTGSLPPVLRERLGLAWGPKQQRRFTRLCRVSKAARPLMPPQARAVGPVHMRWRRRQIERGDVASPERRAAIAAASGKSATGGR